MGKLIKFLEVTLKYSRKNVVGEKEENDWQNVGNLLKPMKGAWGRFYSTFMNNFS